MSCTEQLAKARAEIKTLNGKLAELQEKHSGKLERSSLEAYTGIVIGAALALFPLTWYLRIGLFLVLLAVATDFVWRSPYTYKWVVGARLVIAAVVVFWIGEVGYANVRNAYLTEKFPPNQNYMVQWGDDPNARTHVTYADKDGNGGKIDADAFSTVIANGQNLFRYGDEYRLLAVCFHQIGSVDSKDVPISKSSLFDMDNKQQQAILMRIPWNSPFSNEVIHGYKGTNYALILVPKSVTQDTVDSLSTARPIVDRGGVILETVEGPP
jgi:hypothetical protein